MDEIIVVGRPSSSFSSEYLTIDLPQIDFSGLFLAGNVDSPIATIAGPNEKKDYTFEVKDGQPKTSVHGATHDQLAGVAHALANASRVPEMDRTLKEMAEKGITLTVNVVDEAPANFTDTQVGGVNFKITGESASGPDQLAPGSEATITVVASRLDPPSGYYNFNFVLTHELGHMTRDAAGEFRGEAALDPVDDGMFKDLFRGFKAKNFLESRDIAMQDHEFTQATGDVWYAYGTEGNNYIDSFQATNDVIFTGAGNDVIFSRGGSDQINTVRDGVKYVVDYGVSPGLFDIGDMINIAGVTATELITTRIGSDAYITYAGSTLSPIEDDNAVIIAGYYANPNGSTVEMVTTDDAAIWTFDLLGWPDGTGPVTAAAMPTSMARSDTAKSGDFERQVVAEHVINGQLVQSYTLVERNKGVNAGSEELNSYAALPDDARIASESMWHYSPAINEYLM